MSYQVFARKTRPRNFSEVVGQEHVLQALANGLDQDRVHHAFLFTGTRGVGKTTIARIFSKALNCEKGVGSNPCGVCGTCVDIDEGRFVDLMEIDAASRTGVDDIRELIDNVQYTPTAGRYKVYLIDEVHMLSKSAFNALLKTLEEPPPHVKFLLATTDPQKLPVTVLSRCLQFHLKRLEAKQIAEHLAKVLAADQISFEEAAVAMLARAADGSLRDSLSLLDQAVAFGGGELKTDATRDMLGLVERDHIVRLCWAIAAGDGDAIFAVIDDLYAQSINFEEALAELATVLQRIAVYQRVPNAIQADEPAYEAISELAGQLSAPDVQLYYQVALAALKDLSLSPDARSGFEMAMLRMLAFKPVVGEVPAPAKKPVEPPAAIQAAKQVVGVAPVVEAKPAETDGLGSEAQKPAKDLEAVPEAEKRENETSQEPPREKNDEAGESKSQSAGEPSQIDNSSTQQAAEPVSGDDGAQAPPQEDSQWASLIRTLPLEGMARQLAMHCVVQKREARHWVLALDGDKQLLNQLIPAKSELLGILSTHLGEEVRVELDVADIEAASSVETPAQSEERRERQRQIDAETAFQRDPNVVALQERFNAEVIGGSVKIVEQSN